MPACSEKPELSAISRRGLSGSVGLALALNTIVTVSISGTVPLLLKGLRADPAVASGPVLTTVADMCGFFLALGLATLALPSLT
jgi:magnesium transporter